MLSIFDMDELSIALYFNIVEKLKGNYLVQNELMLKEKQLEEIEADYFEDMFISEEMGAEKPTIQYFDAVFSKIPDFDKDTSIIIGDSLSSDIKGGINAGIDTCWYNPNRKIAPGGMNITYTISDLSEIENILF